MSYTASSLEETHPDDFHQPSPSFSQKPLLPLSQTIGRVIIKYIKRGIK